jgi:hypothetical protein
MIVEIIQERLIETLDHFFLSPVIRSQLANANHNMQGVLCNFTGFPDEKLIIKYFSSDGINYNPH